MSLQSYQRNVKRKVAGPYLPVCFPAALEQISPNHYYRPTVYKEYINFLNWYDPLPVKKRREAPGVEGYEKMLENLVRPIGCLALEDLYRTCVTTPVGFMRVARRLLANDYRIVVDIRIPGLNPNRSAHSVGIIPVGESDHVVLVSSYVPEKLSGVIPLQKVARQLSVSTERPIPRHPINNANLIALPPAA